MAPVASPPSPQDILAVQATLRKLLSVLLSLPYLADATDVPHTRLLLPHPAEVDARAVARSGRCRLVPHPQAE
jgi:hypothetical protein